MSTATIKAPWRPASNGAGKRHWFVYRDETIPVPLRYHFNAKGQLIWYASMAGAQRVADRLNAELARGTVTVTCRNSWYRLAFSRLPGQEFGPWRFAETVRDLRVSALLSPVDARSLVMEATTLGTATAQVAGE